MSNPLSTLAQPAVTELSNYGASYAAAGATAGGATLQTMSTGSHSLLGRVASVAGKTLQSLSLGFSLAVQGACYLPISGPGAVAAGVAVVLTPIVGELARSVISHPLAHDIVSALEKVILIAAKVAGIVISTQVLAPLLISAGVSAGVALLVTAVALTALSFLPEARAVVQFIRLRRSDSYKEWKAFQQNWQTTTDYSGLAKGLRLISDGLVSPKGRTACQIRDVLQKLSTDQLNAAMEELFQDLMERRDPATMQQFIQFLTVDQAAALSNMEVEDSEAIERYVDDLATLAVGADSHKRHAGLIRSVLRAIPELIEKGWLVLYNIICNVAESVLGLRAIINQEQAEGAEWAKYNLERMAILWAFPAAVLGFMHEKIGLSGPAALIAAGIAIPCVIGLITALYYWGGPLPTELPYCETNMILDARQGKYAPVLHRDDEINELIRVLGDIGEITTKHPLLVGPTGCGKSEIVRGLAQRIADGSVPRGLKGAKVFQVNTASLVGQGSQGIFGPTGLTALKHAVRGHEGKVILFFDELQALAKDDGQLLEQLKTYLEAKEGQLHVIAATTDEELPMLQETQAFTDRFRQLDIAPLDEQKMCDAVRGDVLHRNPGLWYTEDVWDAVLARAQASEKSTLREAKDILKQALALVGTGKITPRALAELEDELQREQEQFRADNQLGRIRTAEEIRVARERRDQLNQRIAEVTAEVEAEKEQVEGMEFLGATLAKWRTDSLRVCSMIQAGKLRGRARQNAIKTVLLAQACLPERANTLRERVRPTLRHHRVRLDAELIRSL